MAKFFLKCFLLVIVLLFGVILGMQQANNGMQAMQGSDESMKEVFEWSKDNGKVEVFGKEWTNHDLEEKQRKLEEIEAFNIFSEIGAAISDGLKRLFQAITAVGLAGLERLVDRIFE